MPSTNIPHPEQRQAKPRRVSKDAHCKCSSEIDDVAADRMLPTETMLAREFAQSPPKLLLNFGRVPPQLSSNARPPS